MRLPRNQELRSRNQREEIREDSKAIPGLLVRPMIAEDSNHRSFRSDPQCVAVRLGIERANGGAMGYGGDGAAKSLQARFSFEKRVVHDAGGAAVQKPPQHGE